MDMIAERHFALHLIKFIFDVNDVYIPVSLKKILDEYPKEELSHFSENITKAVSILINGEKADKIEAAIGSSNYLDVVFFIRRAFDSRNFLTFCAVYGLKALREYCSKKMKSPHKLFETIIYILRYATESGQFTSKSWEDLEEAALQIIEEDRSGKPLDLVASDEFEFNTDTTAEQEFVLRIMHHIFQLYFKPVPNDIQNMLDEFPAHQDRHFTATVRQAVMVLMDVQTTVLERIGAEGMEEFYSLACNSFNERDFLETCVCYARKAVIEYYDENNCESPLDVYEFLVGILRRAKHEESFTSWVNMERIAVQILQEDRTRKENKFAQDGINAKGEEALTSFAVTESGSGSHLFGKPSSEKNSESKCCNCC